MLVRERLVLCPGVDIPQLTLLQMSVSGLQRWYVRSEVGRPCQGQVACLVELGRPHGTLVPLERAYPVTGLAHSQHSVAVFSFFPPPLRHEG